MLRFSSDGNSELAIDALFGPQGLVPRTIPGHTQMDYLEFRHHAQLCVHLDDDDDDGNDDDDDGNDDDGNHDDDGNDDGDDDDDEDDNDG